MSGEEKARRRQGNIRAPYQTMLILRLGQVMYEVLFKFRESGRNAIISVEISSFTPLSSASFSMNSRTNAMQQRIISRWQNCEYCAAGIFLNLFGNGF